ncbi:4-hydroxy-tetrahydrodipicolinate synthase [Candidatus Rhodobacter oscarellae]|uniref:4-hydroxy-tetrahydrodipicolinate synthase n=1 Tax=Candidatus Rhodobacter oscarellae TaxID=1675527 RepID=A0A0J9H009_9RHOB|nr:dihydrodipicolinate synthase family protein [Candidatus Rhodobacter lobularis]KMW59083.1 4-hydroxy-tetrahydrodipicolinate synthase [Candidatus Rhodobacter lobularis]
MIDETASGVYTIACTPFMPDGALDLGSVDTMVDFYAECGATGLTILGMMGEAGKLSAAESEAVIRRVTARTDLPVVVGVSSPGFAAMEALSKTAMDAGAAGVMIAPAGGLKTDGQIIDYYHNVAETVADAPWVLQDFPLATNVVIPTEVILRIVADCPGCVMLKHEDWPGLAKISALRAASDAGDARRISILCGNAGLFLVEEMGRGADGAMTGFAYPEMMRDVVSRMQAGDETAARDIFDAYLPLVRYESQPGLGLSVRKHILAQRGAIAHPTVRRPGGGLAAAAQAEVATMIARQEARLAALA